MHKRKLLTVTLFVFLLCLLAFLGLDFLDRHYCVPVIMYHSVSPDAKKTDMLLVSPKNFERQMRFLKEHRYNIVPLQAVADLLKAEKKIPRRTIAITFDDGYKDNFLFAFPILKKYNLPATVFIIVQEVERPQNDRLSWGEVRAMRDSGLITFGSHAIGPEPLTKIKSDEELKRQIFDSKKILEQELGSPVNAFSYPEGRFNDKIKQLVIDAGYKLAVATNPGKKFPDDDIFFLKRLRISPTSDSLFVFWVEISGYYNFMRENKRKHK